MIKTINELHIPRDLKNSLESVAASFQSFDQILLQFNEGDSPKQLNTIIHNLSLISSQVAQGKGTIGKILFQDDLYSEVHYAVTQCNELLEAINQYGLLFTQNKKWQRWQRCKKGRPSMIEKEMKEISSSLRQLDQLLKKGQNHLKSHCLEGEKPPFEEQIWKWQEKIEKQMGQIEEEFEKLEREKLVQPTG